MRSRPHGFLFSIELTAGFLSISVLLYLNRKFSLQRIRGTLDFHMISKIPSVSLIIVIARFTLVVLLSRTITTRKEWEY